MYYIRFLKTPRSSRNGCHLEAKITITNDLGDSFLTTDATVVAELLADSGTRTCNTALWRGSCGMRALEIRIPLDRNLGKKPDALVSVLIRSGKHCRDADDDADDFRAGTFEQIVRVRSGIESVKIVPVRTLSVALQDIMDGHNGTNVGLVERVLVSEMSLGKIHVAEETGESIARHIWDAGLLLSAHLVRLSNLIPESQMTLSRTFPSLPLLERTLLMPDRPLAVLELGAGTGILSLTLAQFYPAAISHVTLTDLAEAMPILAHNFSFLKVSPTASSIAQSNSPGVTPEIGRLILDWADSEFPEGVRARKWDLVCFADCCYNPDVVPDLVKTLDRLRAQSRKLGWKVENNIKSNQMLVLCAMKRRHESEEVFFTLMKDLSFEVVEKAVLPAGVGGGGEEEEVEVWLFR